MRRTTQLTRVLITAAAAVLLASCSGGSGTAKSAPSGPVSIDQLAQEAKSEGSLTLYMGPSMMASQAWTKAFSDKYGIKLNIYSANTETLRQRLEQEGRTKAVQSDIIVLNDPTTFQEADQNGWLADYTPTTGGQYASDTDLSGQGTYKAGTYYPIVRSPSPLVWNTSKVTPDQAAELQSEGYAALGDPQFKGKIAVSVPSAGGDNYGRWYEIQQDATLGTAFEQKIAANKPAFYTSGSAMLASVEAGEVSVALGIGDSQAVRALAAGAPFQWVYPSPDIGTMQSIAISAKAPHPYAARLFEEWALSTDGLTGATSALGGAPVLSTVTDGRAVAGQSWYKPPTQVDYTWSTNATIASAMDSFVSDWNKVFGYK
jgi:iron(III) transport system substrate-binding protein